MSRGGIDISMSFTYKNKHGYQEGRNLSLPSLVLLTGLRSKFTWDRLTAEKNHTILKIFLIYETDQGKLTNSLKWPKSSQQMPSSAKD